ncbi:hypothetical protein SUGI_0758350 [Cryptomeria japonica]|nr:hypothetical protein SUGI_0758350 [Cryptomeria japonica]
MVKKRTHYDRKKCSTFPVASASASQENCANERLELSFVVGTQLIPHPDKAEKGGEDALFVSNYDGGVLAVADGVSGWADENVDPAVFPKELMANILYSLDDEVNGDPQFLLQKAHAKTCSTGSATVIVAMLEKHGTLKIANVGDCGLHVFRKGQIIFSTSPQEHYFDCPFQLSSEIAGQTYKDAMVYSTDIMEGDIVILGSDGLFDNVFDHEIESVISRYGGSEPEFVKKAAHALADLASTHARDRTFESPYCLEARIQGHDIPMWKKLLGMKFTGGKLDDITVIVGMVVNAPVLSEPNSHLDVVKEIPNTFSEVGEAESSLHDKSPMKEGQPNIGKSITNIS